MIIYLAGNKAPLYSEFRKMEVYLAGCHSRPYVLEQTLLDEKDMELYLAGQAPWKEKGLYDDTIKDAAVKDDGVYILDSFYYASDWLERMIPFYGKFLLDSGAFTIFSGKGEGIRWEEYVDKYADFITRNKVKRFFELDIDSIVGHPRVRELRRRLENKVGLQSIPVWHKKRGKDDFLRMCEEYKYVAIGGIVSGEISSDEYRFFPWFIRQAHLKGAKIHGLGFTNLSWLPKCHFDSVDSTSWTTGNRFGLVYEFTGKTLVKHERGKNQRMRNMHDLALHNFREWVKFQKYARTHL